ncbi:MAG: MFS transporter [Planctomycetota bacterium]|nr:MFS transporter [Planctomycetota bacterium]
MSSLTATPHGRLDDHGTHDRWFILSLLFVNYFTLYAHRYVLNYIQPPIREELGLSDSQLFALAWAFQFFYAFAALFVGYLSDRYRRRTVLILSLLLSTAAFMGMGLAQGFWDLLALRILLAITQAANVPAIAGIMADCFTQRNRSRAVSVYLLSSPFSVIVAGVVGGYVADQWGWRPAMFCFGAMGLVVIGVLFGFLREPQRTQAATAPPVADPAQRSLARTLLAVLSVPSFLLLAVAYLLASNVWQQLNFFLPLHLYEHYKTNLAEAGLLSTLAPQIGTVIGLFLGGMLADRWARHWVGGRFGVQILGLSLTVPAVLAIALVDSQLMIQLALLLCGVGFWLYLSNLWVTTFEVVDPAARSTAIGLLNVIAGLLGSWPYLVVGQLRDAGLITDLRHVFLAFVGVLCVAIAALWYLVGRTLVRDRQPD